MLCCVKNVPKLYASLLDKTKPYAEELTPALLKNLVLVGCLILVKETVNLNKLKNHVGILLGNSHTQTESNYRRLTRFFHLPIAQRKLWNRSAEAMAYSVDDCLRQELGWPLYECLPDLGCHQLEVWGCQYSVTSAKPGLSKRQSALVLGQSGQKRPSLRRPGPPNSSASAFCSRRSCCIP